VLPHASPEAHVSELVEHKLDAIRSDRTAHQLRLQKLLPDLTRRFERTRAPVEIRACADAILTRFDDAPVRSFVNALAHRETCECLRRDTCDALVVHCRDRGAASVTDGGDRVANEVCALIAERAIPTIYGNYDYAIARDEHDCGCAYVTAHDRELGQQSVEWTLAHTDETSKAFMRELRFDLRFAVGERNVHLVHGSPRKVNEYLFEDKPASLYERLATAEEGRRARLRTHPQAVGPHVRRRAVRQLRLGRQAQGRRPARRVRRPGGPR
jgi:hypothetical protein